MDRSRSAFEAVVWPAVAPFCGGGELVHLEGSKHRTDVDLDILAGIDGYQRLTGKGLRGIAARVQPVSSRPWQTTTVRYRRESGADTEFEKRLLAIQNPGAGWMYAHLSVHAYVSSADGRLLSAAMIRTEDLILHLVGCGFETRTRRTSDGGCFLDVCRDGGSQFVVCPWDHLESSGVRVKRYPKPTTTILAPTTTDSLFLAEWGPA